MARRYFFRLYWDGKSRDPGQIELNIDAIESVQAFRADQPVRVRMQSGDVWDLAVDQWAEIQRARTMMPG